METATGRTHMHDHRGTATQARLEQGQVNVIRVRLDELEGIIKDCEGMANTLTGGLPPVPTAAGGYSDKVHPVISGDLPQIAERIGLLVEEASHLRATLRQAVDY